VLLRSATSRSFPPLRSLSPSLAQRENRENEEKKKEESARKKQEKRQKHRGGKNMEEIAYLPPSTRAAFG